MRKEVQATTRTACSGCKHADAVELTDRFIKTAKAGEGRKTDYFDTVVKGMCLRASAGGPRHSFSSTAGRTAGAPG